MANGSTRVKIIKALSFRFFFCYYWLVVVWGNTSKLYCTDSHSWAASHCCRGKITQKCKYFKCFHCHLCVSSCFSSWNLLNSERIKMLFKNVTFYRFASFCPDSSDRRRSQACQKVFCKSYLCSDMNRSKQELLALMKIIWYAICVTQQ